MLGVELFHFVFLAVDGGVDVLGGGAGGLQS